MTEGTDGALLIVLIISAFVLGLLSFAWYADTNQIHNSQRIYQQLERSEQCLNNVSRIVEDHWPGVSMLPALHGSVDMLTIPYDPDVELVPGDVVIYQGEHKRVAHRVLGVYPDYIVTMGDGNIGPDKDAVNYTQIVSVVCGYIW